MKRRQFSREFKIEAVNLVTMRRVSVAQAARLLGQGALEVGGQTLREREAPVPYGAVVRVGRRRFFRVVKGQA